LLLSMVMFAGLCAVRVPMAGDCSWHNAPGTPGVFTDTCCSVPLTIVEEPAKRKGLRSYIAAVTRCIGQAPDASAFWLKIYRVQSDGGSIVLYLPGERRAGPVLGGQDRPSVLAGRSTAMPASRRWASTTASGTGSS
jgi:hypothetical protein